jgi:hypothetical protein
MRIICLEWKTLPAILSPHKIELLIIVHYGYFWIFLFCFVRFLVYRVYSRGGISLFFSRVLGEETVSSFSRTPCT